MKQTKTFEFPKRPVWEKLLSRWSDFPNCGEKRLIVAVIAEAIACEVNGKGNGIFDIAERRGFWGAPLDMWCHLISLHGQYVVDQILLAHEKHGLTVEIEE